MSKKENVKVVKAGKLELPKIKVQNIVVSADLHASIDLYTLSKEVRSVDYEPEQFPGAIYRNVEPKAVIILFKNGKMICTGANTEANVKRVLNHVAEVMIKYVVNDPNRNKLKIKKPATKPKKS